MKSTFKGRAGKFTWSAIAKTFVVDICLLATKTLVVLIARSTLLATQATFGIASISTQA